MIQIETVRDWYCPNCGKRDQTVEAKPHVRMHTCPRLSFLSAPMIPAGTRAKVTAREREDYIGSEIQQTADLPTRQFGPARVRNRPKPVMAVVTERDNGQDVAVFAPLARRGNG